jgi:signal transduction histidine kinase
MEKVEDGPQTSVDPGSGAGRLTPEALEKLFQAFSRTSREMERSHAELQARVEALTRELAEKDRRLEQKKRLEALGLVVAGVAHEFRNPLGSFSLYLDCLADVVRDLPAGASGEAAAIIGKIETGVRHLNAIVEDMLIFARPSAPLADRCDLPRLIDEALVLLHGDIEASGVSSEVDIDPGLLAGGGATVTGDRVHTVRIFMNVLKNAIQAVAGSRPPGERRVRVSVRAYEEGGDPCRSGFIEVAVRDNGPGIPAERREKLFVPFFTEKRGGVGLGLTIVHSLIERQGGRVEVESPEEGGLLVRLLFSTRTVEEEPGDGNGNRTSNSGGLRPGSDEGPGTSR